MDVQRSGFALENLYKVLNILTSRSRKTEFQHFLDRIQGPSSQAFLQLNGGVYRLKAVMQLLKCVETHVGTGIAAASVDTWNIDQGFVGDPLLHLVKNPRFREDDECVGAAGFGVPQKLAG